MPGRVSQGSLTHSLPGKERTGNLGHDIRADVDIRLDAEVASVHGTHARQLRVVAWVQVFRNRLVAVHEELQLGADHAGDVGDALDVEAQTPVVGREGDIEESGREPGVRLARVERRRCDDALAGGEGERGRQKEGRFG